MERQMETNTKTEDEGETKLDTPSEFTIADFEFVSGRRRGGKLLYMVQEKQLYVYKVQWFSKRDGNQLVKKYICYEKGCKASVSYMPATNLCRASKRPHSHESTQEERRKNFDFLNACKNAASNPYASESLHEIYTNHMEHNSMHQTDLSYAKIKRTLYRLRKDSLTPKKEVTVKLPRKQKAPVVYPIRKSEPVEFVRVTHQEASDSSMQHVEANQDQVVLPNKTEEEAYDDADERPCLDNQREAMSDGLSDDNFPKLYESNALEDKSQMLTVLESLLMVQKKRLTIDLKRWKVEEKRLAIEEKRLEIAERKLAIKEREIQLRN